MGIRGGDVLGHLHDDLDTRPRIRDVDRFAVALGGKAEAAHVADDAVEVVGIVDAERECEELAPLRRYEPQLVSSVLARQYPG
jgi:hypothetical protein